MDILIPGNLEALKETKTFQCVTCGCRFNARRGEYVPAGLQYNQEYYMCICPCCDHRVYSE